MKTKNLMAAIKTVRMSEDAELAGEALDLHARKTAKAAIRDYLTMACGGSIGNLPTAEYDKAVETILRKMVEKHGKELTAIALYSLCANWTIPPSMFNHLLTIVD